MSEGTSDFSTIIQKAQEMQARLLKAEEEAQKRVLEASAGGGMVTVKLTGGLQLLSIHIEPQAIDPNDPTMLQDLIVAAVNQGIAKARELQANELSSFAAGLQMIPGLL
jgi:DNA-binding YbaB/EbfC family protein